METEAGREHTSVHAISNMFQSDSRIAELLVPLVARCVQKFTKVGLHVAPIFCLNLKLEPIWSI